MTQHKLIMTQHERTTQALWIATEVERILLKWAIKWERMFLLMP